jgi:hypothetical protein
MCRYGCANTMSGDIRQVQNICFCNHDLAWFDFLCSDSGLPSSRALLNQGLAVLPQVPSPQE